MITMFCYTDHQFYEVAASWNWRTHHQEEERTIKMHPFCSLSLLVVPDTADQFVQHKLALVWRCNTVLILHIFQHRLAAIAILWSAEKAIHQIYDEVFLKALTPVFYSHDELRYVIKFKGILINFSLLEPYSMCVIIFFIHGRLDDFYDFPSPYRNTQGHIHIKCCDRKLLPI